VIDAPVASSASSSVLYDWDGIGIGIGIGHVDSRKSAKSGWRTIGALRPDTAFGPLDTSG
jgi:hypothetical protein